MNRVTLQTIADATGLSRATVSRALKNHPDISPATIEKVQLEARRLGYEQDARISELMLYLRRRKEIKVRPCIALIRPESNPQPLNSKLEIGLKWLAGVLDHAKKSGFEIEIFQLEQKPGSGAGLSKVLWNRGIRGVIIGPLEKPEIPIELIWDKFCLVTIGNSLRQPSLHRVMSNHYKAFTELAKKLIKLNYQKIGCVISEREHLRTNYIYQGAVHAMKKRYGNSVFAPAYSIDYSNTKGFINYCEKHKIDVVVSAMGYDLMSILRNHGLRIPQDIGVAGLQVSDTQSQISGMNLRDYKVGCHSVDVLSHVLYYNETGIPETVTNTLIDPCWVEGQTTRKPSMGNHSVR